MLTIPNFVTAGSGRALVNVAERLDRNQFSPVVAVKRRGGTDLERRLESVGIEVIELDLCVAPRPYTTLPLRSWVAARELRRRSIAIVHSFDYSDTYTEALSARFGGAFYVATKKNMGWGSRAWYLRSLLSHRIAVQNEAMFRRFFSSRMLRGRTRYIPRGVVVEHFAPGPADPNVRSSLGIPAAATVVCSVASICMGKNQELLVRALPEDPHVYLLLVGPVLEQDYLEKLTAAAEVRGVGDRVVIAGQRSDVGALLAVSDVFALASRAEGSPVALLEAMSAGLPILATTIPGVSELLAGTGAAILVDPDDLEQTTLALADLCHSEEARSRVGSRASALVRARRSIDLEVARTESLYLELLW